MDIPARFKELLAQRGLTQTRVAERAGLPDETVSRIASGATADPRISTMLKLVRGLGMTLGSFIGEKGFEFTPERRAELRQFVEWGEELLRATQPDDPHLQPPNAAFVALGRKPPRRAVRRGRPTPASATTWRESFGDRLEEEEVDIPQQFANRGANVVFRAEGDSMIGAHIVDGDLLYIREDPEPARARGKIVVCVVGGSPYVKRLDLTGGRIRLLSANDRFQPMLVDEESLEWKLVGVVVGWSHDAR